MDDVKQAEVDYPLRMDEEGRRWLETKPFGGPPAWAARHLLDVAGIVSLLELGPGIRFCELGCGSGWIARLAARCGAEAVGYDIAPGMIEIARAQAAEEHVDVRYEVGDMEELDLGREFDACLVYEALHHSNRPDRVLASAHAALRPGGRLLLVEPNWAHRFFGREATREFGTTENGFSTRHVKKLARDAGFTDVRRFHSNRRLLHEGRPLLYGNRPADVLQHVVEPVVYRVFAPFWAQMWIRGTAT
jgi:2-polyprenyl-3-methyl-5-hydroxy-6-metoxy-1,4-benzoquinol methylase